MWIEDVDGDAYNLDFAFAAQLERPKSDKLWRVIVKFVNQAWERMTTAAPGSKTITAFSSEHEHEAVAYFKKVKAALPTI
jgi:hypothetical protein